MVHAEKIHCGSRVGEAQSGHDNLDIFIISEIPDDKITDVAFVNAMLVRGYGAIENITTVPAIRAEDAMPHMRKAGEMASAMVYQSPAK